MSEFRAQRLRVLMEPEPGNELEVEGVLNPAAARGPDGHLYLFPRMVAKGNYSRIGIAKVLFDDAGDPCGVERMGIALEPQEDYELRPTGGGGCEDPRITYVEPLRKYLMSYAAFSPAGPRVAFAISDDLLHWKRLGLAKFTRFDGMDFIHVDDKDSSFFPVAVANHVGKMELALLHRPLFAGTRPEETVHRPRPRLIDLDRESIWISYCPMPPENPEPTKLGLFNSHHRVAAPKAPWEQLKIGGGTPPILTRHGWMIVYHGVQKLTDGAHGTPHLSYSAGVAILAREHPRQVVYRSPEPVLSPSAPEELAGAVASVVFPTGIDQRNDLGQPDRFDVYYGMADSRIGVFRLDVPEELPTAKSPAKSDEQQSNTVAHG